MVTPTLPAYRSQSGGDHLIKPQAARLLRYVNHLVKETDIGWSDVNHDNPERLCDQVARRSFNRNVLTAELEGQSFNACTRMLANLVGEYGQHLRGILDFAAEQVGQMEEDPVKVSTTYKYPIFIEDLIITLHERLGHYDVRVEPGINIQRYRELTSQDIKTLSGVGISVETLTAHSYRIKALRRTSRFVVTSLSVWPGCAIRPRLITGVFLF